MMSRDFLAGFFEAPLIVSLGAVCAAILTLGLLAAVSYAMPYIAPPAAQACRP